MAGYSGIIDVSNLLVELLREHLSPDLIRSPDTIGLCSPDDHGEFQLGIHLFDIRIDEEFVNTGMFNLSSGRQRYPSTYLALHYMITAYSTADLKYRAAENQRILGKVVQVLSDYAVLAADENSGTSLERVVRMMKLPAEEKHRMWNYDKQPVQTSLYYKVAPVEIESGKERRVRRVTGADISILE